MAEELSSSDPQAKSNHLKFTRLNFLPLGLFFVGIFVMALGAGLFLFKNQDQEDIQIIESASSSQTGQIIVHVDGAVKLPGVYTLPSDSRVVSAVEAAGGLNSAADQSKINLAAKLADGQKIHIPEIGEVKEVGGVGAGVSSGSNQSSLVSINDASQGQLEDLPAIGPVTAQKIIASRPYSAVEELLTRKVVSKSVYEKIKEQITVF